MNITKLVALSLGLVILSALVFVGATANAQNFRTGDNVTVTASETIDSMLFIGGDSVDIAGVINGDVYCAGQTINISGTINGDVFCAGQTLTISGVVEGSARLAGQNVTISGQIADSATIGTQILTIDKNSVIGRDLLGGSQTATINGKIARDMVAGSQNLVINGIIGRNIKGGFDSITIGATGNVAGNIEYISNSELIINNGGEIIGAVTRTAPTHETNSNNISPMKFTYGWFIYVFITLTAVALVLVALFPRILNNAASSTIKAPGMAALTGSIALILVPFIILFLFMSVVGIPLAVITLLAWLIIIMISGPFAGYTLGSYLLLKNKQKPIWTMLLGSSVLIVVYYIPFIGFITFLAGWIFGTGMILIQSKKLLQRSK